MEVPRCLEWPLRDWLNIPLRTDCTEYLRWRLALRSSPWLIYQLEALRDYRVSAEQGRALDALIKECKQDKDWPQLSAQ